MFYMFYFRIGYKESAENDNANGMSCNSVGQAELIDSKVSSDYVGQLDALKVHQKKSVTF